MSKKKAAIMILSLIAIGVVIYFLFFYKKQAESSYVATVVPGVPRWQLPKVMGKVKYVGNITNKPQRCPAGSHPVTNSDGSYGCVQNVS